MSTFDIWEVVVGFVMDIGVYGFCLVGVLMSRFIPDYRVGREVSIEIEFAEIVVAAVIAAVVMFAVDHGGDHAGRMRNFKRRALLALSSGAMWHTIIAG